MNLLNLIRVFVLFDMCILKGVHFRLKHGCQLVLAVLAIKLKQSIYPGMPTLSLEFDFYCPLPRHTLSKYVIMYSESSSSHPSQCGVCISLGSV